MWRPQHLRPPVLAGVLLVLLAFVAAPAATAKDTNVGVRDRPDDPLRAAFQEQLQARELARLPRETATGRCLSTRHVAGLGPACRSVDGFFRLELASGATVLTHGGDAPAGTHHVAASMPHLSTSQAAIDHASAADVACTTAPGDPRVELVYAYPAGAPNRAETVVDPLRMALYQASAFLDAESQALDATAGRRIRVLCDDAGVPVVHVVELDALASSGAEYGDVVNQLVARGFPTPDALSPSPRRFAIFYDADHAGGAAGVASLWYDDTPGTTNLNNRGGRYAVEFDWSTSRLPHWDVLLHEISHNMGAVLDAAPDASGGGHCNDGLDVMCYDDGGATSSYDGTTCSVERYDCGGDTYFHPSPTADAWLATHWNVGSTANAYLLPRSTGWDDGGTPDTVPPTSPDGIAVTSRSGTRIDVGWGAATDDRSIVRYALELDRLAGGGWSRYQTRPYVETLAQSFVDLPSGTTWRIRVSGFDQAGNVGPSIEVETGTLAIAPPPPSSIGLTVVDGTTVDAAWPTATAPAGVRGYELELQRTGEPWFPRGETAALGATFAGLVPGATYVARVRTVDLGGAVSAWRTSLPTTLPGRLAGGEGTLVAPSVAVGAVTASTAIAGWTSSPGAASWLVRLVDDSGRARLHATTSTTLRLRGLRPATGYDVEVTALAADGAPSDAGTATFRTRGDDVAPGLVRLAALPRRRGTTLIVRWRAATDDVAIARYVVQRRVGRRWVRIVPRGRSVAIRRVSPRSRVVLRIRAVDTSGNAGRWSLLVAAPLRRR